MHNSNEAPAPLRIGKVVEFSPDRHAARVLFPDLDGKVSGFLPLLIPNSLQDKHIRYLDEGEHVVCLMQGQGSEFGVILGSFYDDKNIPPVKAKHSATYSDGTQILYDRDNSRLSVHCVKDIIIEAEGNIEIKAGSHIGLKASRIDLN